MGKQVEKEESCSDSFFLKREREQQDSCSSEPSVDSQIAIPDPSPRGEQLRRIYSPKKVPKFPKSTANPLSISSMLSRTMSSGRGSGSKSKSGPKHWKSDLVVALTNLVSSHNLNLLAVDHISDKLDTEMKLMVFLGLDPNNQMREVGHLIGSCASVPVESPPSASTQLVEFSPSTSTQPL